MLTLRPQIAPGFQRIGPVASPRAAIPPPLRHPAGWLMAFRRGLLHPHRLPRGTKFGGGFLQAYGSRVVGQDVARSSAHSQPPLHRFRKICARQPAAVPK
jgi:hypothetical protein